MQYCSMTLAGDTGVFGNVGLCYVGLTMESQDTAIEPAISAEAAPLGTISHDARRISEALENTGVW